MCVGTLSQVSPGDSVALSMLDDIYSGFIMAPI